MVCLYQYLISKGRFKVIDHQFPEVGHTYLDSDRHFGSIEKEIRKHQHICIPEQYCEIISKSNKKNLVIDMSNHFCKTDDFITMMKLFIRRIDLLGESVSFRDGVKWMHVEEHDFYCFKESYDPNTPFKKVNIKCYVNQEAGIRKISISRLSQKSGKLSKAKEPQRPGTIHSRRIQVVLQHAYQ